MVGHVAVVVPFILRTTIASLSQLDPALLDTSASLGAGPLYTFWRVTLPAIRPGILAGAFLAFMASLDNGMSLLNTEAFWQPILKGAILVAAVAADMAGRRKS